MLRDNHFDNHASNFLGLIVFSHEKSKRALSLKTGQQIYFCNSNMLRICYACSVPSMGLLFQALKSDCCFVRFISAL